MQIAPFQAAPVSQEVLLNLYCNENKPPEITPLDLALVSYLIIRKAFDHELFDSQQTLALRCNVDHKAIKRSLERLDELGWITYRGQGNGLPKGISLNISNLPAAQPIREKITPDAQRLVDFYLELKNAENKKIMPTVRGGRLIEPTLKLPRNWKQRQLPSAQRLLTRYDNYDKASQVVFALFNHEDGGIRAKSRQSLYNLLNMLPKARKIQEHVRDKAVLEEISNATAARYTLPVDAIPLKEDIAA